MQKEPPAHLIGKQYYGHLSRQNFNINFPLVAYGAKCFLSVLQRQGLYSSSFPVTQGSADTGWRPDA